MSPGNCPFFIYSHTCYCFCLKTGDKHTHKCFHVMFRIHQLQLWMQSAYIVPLYYNSTDCQLVPFLHMVSIYAEDIIVPYALYSQLIESCKDIRARRDHYCNGISLMNRNLFMKNQIHVANFLSCRYSVLASLCLPVYEKESFHNNAKTNHTR